MTPLVSMRRALSDPELFGRVFDGESWAKWRIILIAAMGEELTAPERVVFESLTGRPREPLERVEELWLIFGRRSGKTRAAAVLGAYIAALCDHSAVLAPGERATLPILSMSTWQAQKALQYLRGIFDNVPALAKLVEGQTADTIGLSTRVDLEVRPASWRTIRSGTAVAFIADEVAMWRDDNSANPDTEILNAARPSLGTTGGPLIAMSTPYAERGELFTTFKQNFGPDGDPLVLVAMACTEVMNPVLSPKIIQRAFQKDATAAASEYGSIEGGLKFRTDVEGFLTREAVEAIVETGCHELTFNPACHYAGFVDAAGGSGQDSFTWAIGHQEAGIAVLDLVREVKPPFSPEAVVERAAADFRVYRISRVKADKWGSAFVTEAFTKHGIRCDQSAEPKSEIYAEFLPLANSGKARLLDNARLIAQLTSLERRTARGGRESIDHPPKQHDDLANAACGCLVSVKTTDKGAMPNMDYVLDRLRAEGPRRYDDPQDSGEISWRFRPKTREDFLPQPTVAEPSTRRPASRQSWPGWMNRKDQSN